MVHSKIKRIWSYLKINLFIISPCCGAIFIKKRCQLRVVDVVAESNVNVEFQTSSRQFDVVLVAP